YVAHFFLNSTATSDISTLSLHDALPICNNVRELKNVLERMVIFADGPTLTAASIPPEIRGTAQPAESENPGTFADQKAEAERRRSEEHTSELQSRSDLVCRLLLEKKKQK